MQTKAQQYLNQAVKDMQDRAGERDQPEGERSMVRTVNAFNAMHGTSLTEVQGWQFMELLKMARSIGGQFRADDFIDGAAYAALAGESAANIDAGTSSKESKFREAIQRNDKQRELEPPFVQMNNKLTQLYAGQKYYIQLTSDTGYHLVTYSGKFHSVNGPSDIWNFEDGRGIPLLRSGVSVFDKLMNEGDISYTKIKLKGKYYMLKLGAAYNISCNSIAGRESARLVFEGIEGDGWSYWRDEFSPECIRYLLDNKNIDFISVFR